MLMNIISTGSIRRESQISQSKTLIKNTRKQDKYCFSYSSVSKSKSFGLCLIKIKMKSIKQY